MNRNLNNLSAAFTAGAVGAAVNSAALLAGVQSGVLRALHVMLAPHYSPGWLYPRLVWGSLWGLLLLIPIGGRGLIVRGLVWSLAPSLFQLLWVFPHKTPLGLFGMGAGQLTPLVVLVVNIIWGLAAAVWLHDTRY